MDTSQNFQIFTIGPDVEGDDSKKAFTWQFIMRPMNECKGFYSEPGTMYLYQSSWDIYSDLKNHSDKTNKKNSPNTTGETNKQWRFNSLKYLYNHVVFLHTEWIFSFCCKKVPWCLLFWITKEFSNPVQNTSLHQLSNNCTLFTLKVDSAIHRTGIFALYKVYLRGMHDRWTKVFR